MAELAIQQAEARALLWSQEMARAAPLAKAQGATAAPARAAEAPREREPAKARGAVRERDQALVAALGQDRSLGSRFKGGEDATAENTNPRSPNGKPAFHRIAEVHFPSMQALEACAASDGGKQTLANAVTISSGGTPVFLIAEQEIFEF